MWEDCGMARTEESLMNAIERIPQLRKEFWENLRAVSYTHLLIVCGFQIRYLVTYAEALLMHAHAYRLLQNIDHEENTCLLYTSHHGGITVLPFSASLFSLPWVSSCLRKTG